MEWWQFLIIIFGLLILFLLTGLPVAFSFTLFNLIGIYLWMGGMDAFPTLALSAFATLASFPLIAVPLFIFMGELILQSGVATRLIDVFGKWAGGMRGSLGLSAVGSGALFGALSGSSMASVAVLGTTLVPEMRRRGYKHELSLGPVMAAGGLDVLIPPSALAVLLGSLAQIRVDKLLISGIIPAVLLASLYTLYILTRAWLQPELAPAYVIGRIGWREKLLGLASVLPMGIIIFLVVGLMFLGLATPSEAAATGVVGTLIVVALYGGLKRSVVRRAALETVSVTSMVFLIIMGSAAFGQILAFTGVTRGLVEAVTGLGLSPLLTMFGMQLVLLCMGFFLEPLSIMLITIPIYMPIVNALALDPVWFGLVMLLALQMGGISPPFGMYLFTLKGVVKDVSMSDIYRAGIPFFLLQVVALVIIVLYPPIATWLPGLMR